MPAPAAERRAALIVVLIAICVYVVTNAGLTWTTSPAPPDSLYNAILARNLARGDGYRIQVVSYHAGLRPGVWNAPDMHGILQPLLLAGVFRALGPDYSLAKLPGYAWVGVAALAAFLLARRLFGAAAGVAAALLVLGNAALRNLAWAALDDVGFVALLLVTLLALVRAIQDGTRASLVLAGVCAGVAFLQKASGAMLLLPLVATLALLPSRPGRGRVGQALLLFAPWLCVYSLYVARNWLAGGSLGFRWGALDWIYKSRGMEFFALHETPPSLLGILHALGLREVARIILAQLREFAEIALTLPAFPFLAEPGAGRLMTAIALPGYLALAWHARRAHAFAILSLFAIIGLVALVCAVFHFEPRFFTPLIPLLCVSCVGAMAACARPPLPGPAGIALRGAAVAFALALCLCALWDLARLVKAVDWAHYRYASGDAHLPSACADAEAWIREHTLPTEPVLCFDAWTLTWNTDRPAVVVPWGGEAAITRIAEHYRTPWVLTQPLPPFLPRQQDAASLERVVQEGGALRPALAFETSGCAVYRLAAIAGPGAE